MNKSIYLTTCGRCGTHWVKHMLCDTLGFRSELPDVHSYHGPLGRIRNYIRVVRQKEEENAGGYVYVYHTPLDKLRPILGIVNICAIIRDPRDVTVSSAIFAVKKGRITVEQVPEYINHKVRNGGFFITIMASYLKYKEEFGLYIVKYEDMLTNTQEALSGILDRFGYKYNIERVLESVNRRSFVKMSGGRQAGDENPHDHVRKGIIGDWKNHFTEEDNEIFLKRHGHIMKEFGYL